MQAAFFYFRVITGICLYFITEKNINKIVLLIIFNIFSNFLFFRLLFRLSSFFKSQSLFKKQHHFCKILHYIVNGIYRVYFLNSKKHPKNIFKNRNICLKMKNICSCFPLILHFFGIFYADDMSLKIIFDF